MKKVFIFIVLSIFFGFLFYYLVNNISIWNEGKVEQDIVRFEIDSNEEFIELIERSKDAGLIFDYLDLKNAFIINFILALTLYFGFGAFHLFTDKLFFKKFYEEPNLNDAIRRAFWFVSFIAIFYLLRILGIDLIWVGLICFILSVIIVTLEMKGNKRLEVQEINSTKPSSTSVNEMQL